MRFIHTGDWHLGRLFHEKHLTEDQRFALEGLVRLAVAKEADAVVVAGDVFDRGVPPVEAVDLLDDVLGELVLERRIPVVLIAGNHDSAARLEFLSGLASRAGAHMVGRVGSEPRCVEIAGSDGVTVAFWPLAFTDPETARHELDDRDIHSHEAAIAAQVALIRPRMRTGVRHVLVGHAFVTGATATESSERALSVGGTGQVSAGVFDGFDYVALGHLHRPQDVVRDRVRYAGSLLKYSFEEADHVKSVTVVDVAADGSVSVAEEPIAARHDLHRVEGSFAEIMASVPDPEVACGYVEIVLTDDEPVIEPMRRLRELYPNALSLRRPAAEYAALDGPGVTALKERTTPDLFGEFFEEVTGEPMSPEQSGELARAVEAVERAGREGDS